MNNTYYRCETVDCKLYHKLVFYGTDMPKVLMCRLCDVVYTKPRIIYPEDPTRISPDTGTTS